MTATNRRATVTKQYDFAAVSEPYTATIYDGAVTNRHVISYPLRVCAHARGKDLRAMGSDHRERSPPDRSDLRLE
ncbi:MAG: hypothetical protein QGF59_10605 [Pirellulaceae bacterium]|nr:hypothetical protein [Pirellulaceae bacterium]